MALAGTGPQAPTLTVLSGRRGVPVRVTVRATALADLHDELAAIEAELLSLVDGCLPLARRMTFAAQVIGPEMMQEAMHLVALLERARRQHSPERVA